MAILKINSTWAVGLLCAALFACTGENKPAGDKQASGAEKISGSWVIADVQIDPALPENKALAEESPDGYEIMTGLLVQQSVGRRYDFGGDGKFNKFVPYDSSTVSGTWQQDGAGLNLAYKDGDAERKESYIVESQSDSVLRLLSKDKMTVKYVLTRPL